MGRYQIQFRGTSPGLSHLKRRGLVLFKPYRLMFCQAAFTMFVYPSRV